MPTGPQILLILKVLVAAVTVLFAASLVALARKNFKLHGRINTAFFVLTMLTVIVFELLIRFAIDVQHVMPQFHGLGNSPLPERPVE